MGGAIDAAGNATPVAEFNIWADARAAARVFALTSPIPSSTMPPLVDMKPYPEPLSKQLEIVMFPWDLTTKLLLSEKKWESIVAPLMEKKSPLAEWMNMFIGAAFRKMEAFYKNDGDENGFFKEEGVTLCLNDPICVCMFCSCFHSLFVYWFFYHHFWMMWLEKNISEQNYSYKKQLYKKSLLTRSYYRVSHEKQSDRYVQYRILQRCES